VSSAPDRRAAGQSGLAPLSIMVLVSTFGGCLFRFFANSRFLVSSTDRVEIYVVVDLRTLGGIDQSRKIEGIRQTHNP